MSVSLVSRALAVKGIPKPAKLVLIVLAEKANREGFCWPSRSLLMDEAEMRRTQLYEALKELEREGYIVPEKMGKKNGFRLTFRGEINVRKTEHGRSETRTRINKVEPSLNRKEPNTAPAAPSAEKISEKKTAEKTGVQTALPGWLPTEKWQAFRDSRKKMRKPLTEHAEKLLLKQLEEFHADGGDAIGQLDRAIMNGWQGIIYDNDRKKPNGKTVASSRPGFIKHQASYDLLTPEEKERDKELSDDIDF